jgi:hypothetical protein
VFAELRRREKLLVEVKERTAATEPTIDRNQGTQPAMLLIQLPFSQLAIDWDYFTEEEATVLGRFDDRLLWSQRDMEKGLELLRDMCDFQAEVLMHNKSFVAAERYVREYPEQLTSRLLSHLQYLFQVPTLEGLLPRLNQVYIFNEGLLRSATV